MTHEFKTQFEQKDCVCWLAGCRAGLDLIQHPPTPTKAGRFTHRGAEVKVCLFVVKQTNFCLVLLSCSKSPT